MKMLIVGGAGFIGCNIGKRLLQEKHEGVLKLYTWVLENRSLIVDEGLI